MISGSFVNRDTAGCSHVGTGVGVWDARLKQSDKDHSDLTGSFLSK